MGFFGDVWNGAQYLIPGYGQYKAGKDLLNSDMLTNANVPTQYQDRDQILGLINQGYGPGGITQQTAPQMQAAQMQAAQLQMGDDPFRRAQLQQLGQLQGITSGQQKGAGELAAERQYGNALAAQQAQARMARGPNAALAYRNAANQSAALGSSAAGMGQQAALQDQMNAQGILGQVGAQGRQGDFGVANANAGYQQQAGLANAGFQQGAGQYNAGLQQQGQQNNAGNYLQLLNQLGSMSANQLSGQQAAVMDANKTKAGLLGGLLSTGGQMAGAAMASDERLKTDVTDARADIDAMLDGMRGPVGWRYKDPKFGEGRFVGGMAQDLERSKAGKEIVIDTPEGKMLDMKKVVGAALASSVRLNERLRKLEGVAGLPVARVVQR